MKDIKSLTDEQLLSQIDDIEIVTEEITLRYMQTVKIKACIYVCEFVEFDDLCQEGMLGLLSAIAHYNKERKASFKTYADRCIQNRMKNMVKKAKRLSLVSQSVDSTVIGTHVGACISPEDVLASREEFKQKNDKIRNILSPLEAQVFDLFLHGYTYEQIANKMGVTVKVIDNALLRARRKLKSIF